MQQTFSVNKPIELVFNYLSDMQKFVSVHPVITKIDALGDNTYLVHETLKLAFIPISFTYKVSVDANYADKRIVIRATVMKFTKIEMDFKLDVLNSSTLIVETIAFHTFQPIKYMLQNIFKEQHQQLFRNIEGA